ncbi:hypothetical protein PQQ75_25205 [Paraburkholderia aspalathi]|uniref:hypothetical protein n=1 Tax=Paraburkholderia aspalathi TaxID=1324617 RepID=UPI0038BD7D8E
MTPEDIPLAAIAAFHEVNPLAPTPVYDWSDKMVENARHALAAAFNVMALDGVTNGGRVYSVVSEAWVEHVAEVLSNAGYSRQADEIRRIEIAE